MVQPVADLLRRWRRLLALLTVLLLGGMTPVLAASPSSEIPDVVATVQGQPISAEELIEVAKSDLIRLETQRYELLKNKLDELVARDIVRLEAAQRGISVEEFEHSEIVAKTPPVTPEAVKEYYEANKERIRQPFEQIEARLTTYLQQRAQQQRQQELFQELMQRYPVTIALRPPKVEVTADDDPATGPADTLVTIIEFSDFQCPYCRRVQPALKRLLEEYQGKVRLVFRDFPLRQAHPQAQKAAEAAQCAADQQQNCGCMSGLDQRASDRFHVEPATSEHEDERSRGANASTFRGRENPDVHAAQYDHEKNENTPGALQRTHPLEERQRFGRRPFRRIRQHYAPCRAHVHEHQ